MDLTFDELSKLTAADETEYKEHQVFKELDKAIEFYDSLDFSVMGFATPGTLSIINLDSLVYSSIWGTLESIKMTLQKGRIGDAFCLLRKYYDSCILNLYTNVYLERSRDEGKNLVEEVTQWMSGTKKLPHNEFRTMLDYLRKKGKKQRNFGFVFSGQKIRRNKAKV